jgi:pyruvate dehydrogenase E1 component
MVEEHGPSADPPADRPRHDPQEGAEWVDAIRQVLREDPARAVRLVRLMLAELRDQPLASSALASDYVNTIPGAEEPPYPGDEELEDRILNIVRWNAVAMVVRANAASPGIGGHLSTYASTSMLYEVAFNHVFRGRESPGGGDHVYFQSAAATGIYARAFLEGRLTREQLERYRRETEAGGIPSYIHPRLMPGFWEYPTASMGLGAINAVYRARFHRYLDARGIVEAADQKVWAFLGDGEMDEPEAIAGLTLASREGLDNLVFVVNCNLQRLDGPVRGNGKIVQELEALFVGAGWRVLKVLWDRGWDDLLEQDVDGALVDRLNAVVDGDLQKYAVSGPTYLREHLFGPDPHLVERFAHLPDERLAALGRGGHDRRKVWAAYAAAMAGSGRPTVILAQTSKGWGLGAEFEARNSAHQMKRFAPEALIDLRDRLGVPVPDRELLEGRPPLFRPDPDGPEVGYVLQRRRALGGFVPQRRAVAKPLPPPEDRVFDEFAAGSERPLATTMALVRLLRRLMDVDGFGERIVPIVADEARTFGMESLFPRYGIYSPVGQLYEPVDADAVLRYRETRDGQVLQEGITEAGAISSFAAAGTSYASHGEHMVPFFFFYSIFGFQRVADLIWQLGDGCARGFLLGATHGRTTLNGEGLQHQDGHSLLLAESNPACVWFDPAFAFEVATIVRAGLREMIEDGTDVLYYLTLYNEPYEMPAMPAGTQDGILRGLYPFRPASSRKDRPRVQLLGSGSIMREVLRAQALLAEHGVSADVWSAPSYHQLRRDALECERTQRLTGSGPEAYVTRCLGATDAPVVAASDSMKAVPDLIGRWVANPYVSLGTDGFGLSDTREALRRRFEVDAEHIAVAALAALERAGTLTRSAVDRAIASYGISPWAGSRIAADLHGAR